MCKWIACVLFLFGVASVAAAQETQETKPNFVLILADDLTYHDLGAFGNDDVQTPNLDALAADGMRLTHIFTPAPMCAPTRMSLYTGLYPVRNGGHPNHSRVRDGVRSMPHYLQPLGYRVGLIGKKHFAPADNFPFEHLGGSEEDDGNEQQFKYEIDPEEVRRFIEPADGDADASPFCLVVASNQPHTPWNRGDPSAYDPKSLTLPPYFVDTPRTRELLARYYGEITFLDGQVGDVMRVLRETGHDGNTVVLFLSEQGSNFAHAKWTLYDTGIRASGIAVAPGRIEPGTTSDALVSYVDVLPTFHELAGGDPSQLDIDGQSFAGVLRGERDDFRDTIFGIQTSRGIYDGPEHYGIRAARDNRFKYIRNLTPEATFSNTVTSNGRPQWFFNTWRKRAEAGDAFAAEQVERYEHRPAEELYDLEADPYELTNLATDPTHADKLKDLSTRLDAWMTQQGDAGQATELDALNRRRGPNDD